MIGIESDARIDILFRLDVQLIIEMGIELEGGADLIAVKTAILKEARLLCTFSGGPGQFRAELAAPDLRRQPAPILLAAGDFLLNLLVRNRFLRCFQMRREIDFEIFPGNSL